MRDNGADRLRPTGLSQLLVDIAGVDRESARRAERLPVLPCQSWMTVGFDHLATGKTSLSSQTVSSARMTPIASQNM